MINRTREPFKVSGISAVFPAYNDGGTISSMVLTALMALRQVTNDFEIIVTDDGSTDYTGKVLDEMVKVIPELRVIHHDSNRGYGCALRTGFAAAKKEWVFYTDGDAQYNPLELVDLVDALTDGVDVVNGYKITRHDPWFRIVIGRLYHHLVRFAFGIKLKDVDCDFRLMRRILFDEIELESEKGTLPVELVKKFQDHGARFVEVPVHHYHRQYGKSQFFNWRRVWASGMMLISLWNKLVLHKENQKSAQ